jgi:hypothetical protein
MNVAVKSVLREFIRFFGNRRRRYSFFLCLLWAFAIAEFFAAGLVRRTFVFYSIGSGALTVEDRMLKRSSSREIDIRRYVEEVLLGPVSPDSEPLFPRGTRLRSLLYRGGVVYADLTEDAVLPPAEGGDVFRNFQTLREGIGRNFSFVRDIRFFIAGREAFVGEFSGFL